MGVSDSIEVLVAGELFTTVGEGSSEAMPGIPSRLIVWG